MPLDQGADAFLRRSLEHRLDAVKATRVTTHYPLLTREQGEFFAQE